MRTSSARLESTAHMRGANKWICKIQCRLGSNFLSVVFVQITLGTRFGMYSGMMRPFHLLRETLHIKSLQVFQMNGLNDTGFKRTREKKSMKIDSQNRTDALCMWLTLKCCEISCEISSAGRLQFATRTCKRLAPLPVLHHPGCLLLRTLERLNCWLFVYNLF